MKNIMSRGAQAFLIIGSVAQAKSIRLPASHDLWDAAKQRVTLSTGITMQFVEAGNTSGPIAIFLHGYARLHGNPG